MDLRTPPCSLRASQKIEGELLVVKAAAGIKVTTYERTPLFNY